MKTILITLTLTLGLIVPLDAQIIPSDAIWVNTDTVHSERSLLTRHALLNVEWAVQSPLIHKLAISMNELTREFPWLNVVGICHGDSSDITEIQNWAALLGLEFAQLLTGQERTWISDTQDIKMTLYDPAGEMQLDKVKFSRSNLTKIQATLKSIQGDYGRPGKALGTASIYNRIPSVDDLALLDHPRGIAYDNRYGRILISDTGNDRVIICNRDGRVFECVGNGKKGNELGSFDQSELDFPTDVEMHSDSGLIVIADHGNARIVLAGIDNMQTREFIIKDQDGFNINLPSAPTRLSLEGSLLSITLPESQRIWKVDLFSGTLVAEFGSGTGDPVFHKKNAKVVFGNPIGSVSIGDFQYTVDAGLGAIYEMDDSRSRLIFALDAQTASDNKTITDTLVHHPLELVINDEDLYIVDANLEHLIEVDLNTGRTYPLSWNKDSLEIGMISDVCWSDDAFFALDMENGLIHTVENGIQDVLRLSDIERMRSGIFAIDKLLMADPIQLDSVEQTGIEIEFLFPANIILHPSVSSTTFTSSGSELYIENSDPGQGPLKFFAFPEFKRNQINIMGDIYMTEVGNPWKIFRQRIQISIPIEEGNSTMKENYILLEMFPKLNEVY